MSKKDRNDDTGGSANASANMSVGESAYESANVSAGGLLLRMGAVSLAAAGIGAVCAYFSIRLWNNANLLQTSLAAAAAGAGAGADGLGGLAAGFDGAGGSLSGSLANDVVYLAAAALGGIFVMLMICVVAFSRNHVSAVSAKASGAALLAAGKSLKRAEDVLKSRADRENMIAGGLGAISTGVLAARRAAGVCSASLLDSSGDAESGSARQDGDGSEAIEARMYAISLEAAIEAGRAGSAGRAFIEVAEELRSLAVDAEARHKKLCAAITETTAALDESITGCAALLSGLSASAAPGAAPKNAASSSAAQRTAAPGTAAPGVAQKNAASNP